jgi:hypothetical protein
MMHGQKTMKKNIYDMFDRHLRFYVMVQGHVEINNPKK